MNTPDHGSLLRVQFHRLIKVWLELTAFVPMLMNHLDTATEWTERREHLDLLNLPDVWKDFLYQIRWCIKQFSKSTLVARPDHPLCSFAEILLRHAERMLDTGHREEQYLIPLPDRFKTMRLIQDLSAIRTSDCTANSDPDHLRRLVREPRPAIVDNYLKVVRIFGVKSAPQQRIIAPWSELWRRGGWIRRDVRLLTG
ncbi:MAG TPA: hypothetical protein VML55_04325, partial [Planctomycetaceae bacterium]|nr:hypothetical protein [Planctomycetaceae bacterium]